MLNSRAIDITGQRYNRMLAIEPTAERRSGKHVCKVDPAKVVEIRRLRTSGLTNAEVGALFGIHPCYVSAIASRRRWADVP